MEAVVPDPEPAEAEVATGEVCWEDWATVLAAARLEEAGDEETADGAEELALELELELGAEELEELLELDFGEELLEALSSA